MLYVIGSVKQEHDIREIANYFKNKEGFDVKYVKAEPDESLTDLILDCFDIISKSEIIVAVKKPDGSYGTGTTYEICFANFIGKEVIEMSIDDLNNPEWIAKRKTFRIDMEGNI